MKPLAPTFNLGTKLAYAPAATRTFLARTDFWPLPNSNKKSTSSLSLEMFETALVMILQPFSAASFFWAATNNLWRPQSYESKFWLYQWTDNPSTHLGLMWPLPSGSRYARQSVGKLRYGKISSCIKFQLILVYIASLSKASTSTACGHRVALRKWKETKQQPSMLPCPAVPGSCLVSLHFLCYILCTRSV